MTDNPLGKSTVYRPYYDKTLLFPVKREINRNLSRINSAAFCGYDIWNAYEFSYLGSSGKPENRRIRIVYPSDSINIVESKSLKLYLGGFIMSKFSSDDEVAGVIKKDLSDLLGSSGVEVALYKHDFPVKYTKIPRRRLIDTLDVDVAGYVVDPSLLRCGMSKLPVKEEIYSDLLKTNCPVTGQPDWATLYICYKSDKILDKRALLQYIISYREHSDYHEICCEKIFTDINNLIKPEQLIVKCFFTRRGGIDINPCRFGGVKPDFKYNEHYWRQ